MSGCWTGIRGHYVNHQNYVFGGGGQGMIIKNRVMHTPEGMRDLYGKSLQDRRALMKRIHDVFESFGYSDIETPTIEYFDVFSSDNFSTGTGTRLFSARILRRP